MSVLQQLLDYQKVDAQLLKVEQAVAGSEERKKFLQAKKFMESAREKLDMQDKRAAELRRLRDDLAARAEEIERQINEYADLDDILACPCKEKIGRAKYIPEENIAEFDGIFREMNTELKALAAGGGEDV